MTLQQLKAFADSSESHIRQIALTREAARQILAEHEREVEASNQEKAFEVPERDDGKYAALVFPKYAKAEAFDAELFETEGVASIDYLSRKGSV